jgi:hypothetical protein
LPTRLAGEATAATTIAVATDSTTSPPWYRNGEYWVVRQISAKMTSRPAMPTPSSARVALRRRSARSFRLGQTNASAAPISSANARVSVPS